MFEIQHLELEKVLVVSCNGDFTWKKINTDLKSGKKENL